jgi:Antibiotic biosynthesis monooxygenase
MAAPILARSQGVNQMYGLIAKLTAVPRKREELVKTLEESAGDMPGCFSYVVAKDSAEENTLWVTEVWDSQASHDASLVTSGEECSSSSQGDRCEFREGRGHESGMGKRAETTTGSLSCGPDAV